MGYTKEKPSWNGELLIEPFFKDWNAIDNGEEVETEFCTTDNSNIDYDDDQQFAIFTKTETRQIIKALQYAIGDIKRF